MINQALFEQYRIDTNKHMNIGKVCSRPFDTVLIDKRGSCYACECTAWLPQSIGNLQIKSLSEILESPMRRHLQESVSDGSYRYCNEHQCPFLRDHGIEKKTTELVKHLRLAIDDSCNLRCPSCRKHMIFHKEGTLYDLGIRLADRVNDWLTDYPHDLKVHIGSDGDPFASHVYRHFMSNTPKKDSIKYSLLTNGLMIKEFHNRIPHVMNNLELLGMSIDGATQSTYEKLRLGGKWNKAMEALECIAELKDRLGFTFHMHMVVQQDNWHEMEKMLELGHRYKADKVYFNKIEDWSTDIDFSSQTFTEDEDFKTMIWRVSTDPIAWNNVANLI